MSLVSQCRLCIHSCRAYKKLYDENGYCSKTYQIMVQYFHPMLFDATDLPPFNVICLECWRQISDFNNFQQYVIQAQKRLLRSTSASHEGKYGQEPFFANITHDWQQLQATNESSFNNQNTGVRRSKENTNENDGAKQKSNFSNTKTSNEENINVPPCQSESTSFQQQCLENRREYNGAVKHELRKVYSKETISDSDKIHIPKSEHSMLVPKLEIMDVLSEEDSSQDFPYIGLGPYKDDQDTKIVKKRKKYKTHCQEDKIALVNAASRGEDWVSLAHVLGVNYNTAYGWISSGSIELKPKGGMKPKKLSESHVAIMLSWLEDDSTLTLLQLKEKILKEFNISVTPTTVGNYLEGRLYTSRRTSSIAEINSPETKGKRADYVNKLKEYIQEGKQMVWIGETNFHLFCRNLRGRSRLGQRDVQQMPAARGPNMNLLVFITTSGVLLFERQWGPFATNKIDDILLRLVNKWKNEEKRNIKDLVIVCNNSPCFIDIEMVVGKHSSEESTVLRLSPHSNIINPTEYIWSKISENLKKNLHSPPNISDAISPEERLFGLEKVMDEVLATISRDDCELAIRNTESFHTAALSLKDIQAENQTTLNKVLLQ